MSIPSLDVNITQFQNGDLFFDLFSSDYPEYFLQECSLSAASDGDLYLQKTQELEQYTNFIMFQEDYSIIKSGSLNIDDENVRIKIALLTGPEQPTKFILRILDDNNKIFKGSFTIKAGNSGFAFPPFNSLKFFIFSTNYDFQSQLKSQISGVLFVMSLALISRAIF